MFSQGNRFLFRAADKSAPTLEITLEVEGQINRSPFRGSRQINLHEQPVILNVGSIALPRNGARAAYVLLSYNDKADRVEITFKEIHYNWGEVIKTLDNASYPSALQKTVSEQLRNVRLPNTV